MSDPVPCPCATRRRWVECHSAQVPARVGTGLGTLLADSALTRHARSWSRALSRASEHSRVPAPATAPRRTVVRRRPGDTSRKMHAEPRPTPPGAASKF
eukprot:2374181-Prymnesium_polylepis.1